MWEDVLSWASDWNDTQGFWAAIQGVGTLVAAIAALVAIGIARSQLRALTDSNNLLAASNDAMTASNVALTRPYVVVDFEFRPILSRSGGSSSTSIAVKIENVGRTPAKDLYLRADKPFPVSEGRHTGTALEKAVAALNGLMEGETPIKSLNSARPISYYLDEASDIMGSDDVPADEWTVQASYSDADGNFFHETFILELSHWRLALVTTDPLQRIAKNIEGVSYEVKNKRLPSLDFTFPEGQAALGPRRGIGRPRLRRIARPRS